MVIEIAKNTPAKEIKRILKKIQGKKLTSKSVSLFFGKLPGIEDGVAYQKRVRNEWK
jgi:hypothetical protein